MIDCTSVALLADTNSAARPEDQSRRRREDVGYRTFLRAFNLRDLVDMHATPPGTYSCFEGYDGRINTVAHHATTSLVP